MEIIISNSDEKPIYEQIASQIQMQIVDGRLKEGDVLPSMRLLAKDLRVSVITTKRAYEELEKAGFIVTSAGRGSFVAETNLNMIRENSLKQIEELFDKAIYTARKSDISKEEVTELLSLLYESEGGDGNGQ